MMPELADLAGAAPLLTAWTAARAQPRDPFIVPGHKNRAGLLHPDLGRLLDEDIPMCGGVDTVSFRHGYLADAQARAAALWDADWARLSTGGSTHGNQTLCLAVGRPGAKVAVTRALHRSTLSGLVLAGLVPVWLPIEVSAEGVPLGTNPETLAATLRAEPEICAVMLVSPGFLGTATDVAECARIAHGHGVPLIVDQAWGAHLGFHPAYPRHAIAQGADGMIISAHKALPAYSQACIVLANTERIDRDRLDRAFEATHTTSASGNILAGADAGRAVLELAGRPLLQRLLDEVGHAREQLRNVPGCYVPGPADFGAGLFDPGKLVLLLAGTGADGIAVEQDLIEARLPLELADRDTLIAMTTMADDRASIGRLVENLSASIVARSGSPRPTVTAISWRAEQEARMSPRDAFFAPHRTVQAVDAVGQVCAELIAPYPPGVPVLVPGEVIEADTIEALRASAAAGTRVAYAADPTLETFQVVS